MTMTGPRYFLGFPLFSVLGSQIKRQIPRILLSGELWSALAFLKKTLSQSVYF